MNHPRQPSKPSRNRDLVESFDALALAEKADKGSEKILPSGPLSSSRALSENASALVFSATRDNGDEGKHHCRRFSDSKLKEKFLGGFEPVLVAVHKVMDSVRRPSSPNGKVASAPHPNTSGSMPWSRPHTEQRSRTMQHALQMSSSQNQPKTTLQPPQSPPFVTPLEPKRNAPAVSTVYSPQPKPDTLTPHGQKRRFVTPSRPNLDTPAVSTVYSPQPKPDTPTSRGQKRPPFVTPPRPNLDAPAVYTAYSQQSDPDTPPTHGAKGPCSISAPDVLSRPAVVVTPARPRAISSSSSASASPGQFTVQCGATTKSNRPCSRAVKIPPTHAILEPIPAVYCHQHRNMKETGFYVARAGHADRYVEFKDYVPEYLRVDTQMALKEEMARAPSRSDRPGYIYTFEIRDPSTAHLIRLKVGRTVNLKKRLDQWDKQCGSREQVLRGWWPGTVEPDADNGTNGSLLRAQLKAGDPGPLCHRLERLVHIELADLSFYAPYLEPEWPKTNNSKQSPSSASSLSSALSAVRRACTDCGVVHREVFSFRRPNGGKYEGREWDDIVKPVIEKWGRFVKEYYS
ncbi:hypothetical protein PISMIDRAFT_685748 [Pisolithus microcarpus 441]|uniref:DUF1766-domain-containing protein n=1 Tax=Pisolithus microcarpus 441 TaxID=765257 RepID=A0A0C9XX34_9AGAM|nr:hypothetical protein BKA83DRAFT_685748 [Pisolithus microcarpus]KIK17005.1 hypothetical protein PISMIDRAFT_685748 [Pisolithus microcarpus 441]